MFRPFYSWVQVLTAGASTKLKWPGLESPDHAPAPDMEARLQRLLPSAGLVPGLREWTGASWNYQSDG